MPLDIEDDSTLNDQKAVVDNACKYKHTFPNCFRVIFAFFLLHSERIVQAGN